jgi:RimJ/RimL family protein N-acetyltransferase
VIDIIPISRKDYPALFKLAKEIEPYKDFRYYDHFCQEMDNRYGFGYWDGVDLIGYILYSDFIPCVSVVMHAGFRADRRDGMSRRVIKQALGYAFNDLDVHRIASYSIDGVTDEVSKFLLGIGFRDEGSMRGAVKFSQDRFDLTVYGMLKDECVWI